jgi:hypothetical protein
MNSMYRYSHQGWRESTSVIAQGDSVKHRSKLIAELSGTPVSEKELYYTRETLPGTPVSEKELEYQSIQCILLILQGVVTE